MIAGRGAKPANYVTWYDAVRFANWLHNGQPVGAQNSSTTEGGAYTMPLAAARNVGATVFVPTEDEWYKAAYYNGPTTSYFALSGGLRHAADLRARRRRRANSANCAGAVGDFTDVGSYSGSPSPYGTLDQGTETSSSGTRPTSSAIWARAGFAAAATY